MGFRGVQGGEGGMEGYRERKRRKRRIERMVSLWPAGDMLYGQSGLGSAKSATLSSQLNS